MASKRPRSAGEPVLEIQIHPADMRRGVWTYFLTRKHLRRAIAGAVGLALFLGTSMVLFPGVVADLLARRHYQTLVAERTRLGERLQSLNSELGRLQEQTDHLHLKMSRVYLTYGLEGDPSGGQGGYPFPASEVPESLYAAQIRHGNNLEAQISEQLRVLGTFIDEVRSFEAAHGEQVTTTPSASPLHGPDFVLTSPFGVRRSPFTKELDFHPGIDLAAPTGTPIYAPASGEVVFAGRYPLKQSVAWWRYGNLVALRHGDRFITLYGHCDEVLVRTGQKVTQGTLLAKVGNTGWSTSSHLHYEVRARKADGEFEPVDPRIYILDHRWRDEEQLLVRARKAPDFKDFEPLPRTIGRR